jgi:hypothetical protein
MVRSTLRRCGTPLGIFLICAFVVLLVPLLVYAGR